MHAFFIAFANYFVL